MYRTLDATKIVHTAGQLHRRVSERFPDSGLARLNAEVLEAAKEAADRSLWMRRPHVPLRVASGLLLAMIVAILGATALHLRSQDLSEVGTFIQALEAALSSVFFVGAAVAFLVTWEGRIKRSRSLKAIHELRAMAHIVDMHQLTKDPDSLLSGGASTVSSPKRQLTAFELMRYLDYCTESLSLLGKIAALYSQTIDDPVVLDAVDDVEDLTTELSQKIWQKIAMLERSKAETQPTLS